MISTTHRWIPIERPPRSLDHIRHKWQIAVCKKERPPESELPAFSPEMRAFCVECCQVVVDEQGYVHERRISSQYSAGQRSGGQELTDAAHFLKACFVLRHDAGGDAESVRGVDGRRLESTRAFDSSYSTGHLFSYAGVRSQPESYGVDFPPSRRKSTQFRSPPSSSPSSLMIYDCVVVSGVSYLIWCTETRAIRDKRVPKAVVLVQNGVKNRQSTLKEELKIPERIVASSCTRLVTLTPESYVCPR